MRTQRSAAGKSRGGEQWGRAVEADGRMGRRQTAHHVARPMRWVSFMVGLGFHRERVCSLDAIRTRHAHAGIARRYASGTELRWLVR